ncbi:M23 family metallopeptidase [Alkalibacillus haloalkaliphilus]|uniref:Metalloendopeptidase n=1 Tax=Alkalibacillus haloalkaliphilus TaxID=94136 RepID=A0A511W5N3_9BACI|nr:M23 family metallopeptidase [Alkalibacillus haloalkaliphilus]GEN44682.1 metalloendopeptidase [Alkalibacillus haloalkaliphilus]
MKLRNKWRILIMSDAGRSVKHVNVNKLIGYSLLTCVAFVSLSLIISLTLLNQLSSENAHLKETVSQVANTLAEQEQQIIAFEDDRSEIEHHLHELEQLEEQLSNMITTLEPTEIPSFEEERPQGGIELVVNNSDQNEEQESERGIELTSLKETAPTLIERYESSIDQLNEVKEDLETVPIYWPADTERVTSEYGYRSDPFTSSTAYHSGIDLADSWGTEIYATADGVVSLAGRDGGYGISVIIDHPNSYETRYAHLGQLNVEVGDEVQQGDLIGLMGSTGRSTGVHLHYEIIRNGDTTNPYPYMTFLQRVLNN